MPGVYEYIIQMQDRASGTLQKLTGTSYETVQKFVQLQEKTDALKRTTADFGNSIGNLKQKIDILQQERELIDPANLTTIRQYNKEIASLNKTINKLESDTGGSKLSNNFKDAFSQIPGANLITNPLVAIGAGIAGVGKMSMDWQTGMAKINTTAQLSDSELQKLSKTIKKIGTDAKADLRGVPTAYESIISQTNDVTLSNEILMSSLKGSRAGFTEVEVTSKALAQSLSAIGKGKATAAEVMDTLFAAKRVGAGEFSDFANNIPGLIASGKNVDVTWREVSGAFAYMTGKGNDAAQSTMLLQNAFTALGKSEITGGLKAAGVDVYNAQGKLRGILPIMTDLSNLMATMNPEQKSNFFEKIGLKDAQAKQAFSVLTDETSKLQEAMNATANSAGEMQSALDQTNTPANKLKDLWHSLQSPMMTIGNLVLSVINPVFFVLGGLISAIAWSIESVGTAWNWWNGLLQSGNPLIWGLTAIIGGLTISLALNTLIVKASSIGYGLAATASGIWTAVTWVATAAQWAFNTAIMANPIGAVIVLVIGIAAAVYAAWNKFEGFRKVVMGAWEVMKQFGKVLYELIIGRLVDLVKGIGKVGEALMKLFTRDFKGAWQSAKDGFMDMSGMNAAGRAYDEGMKVGDAWKKGTEKGAVSWANSQYGKKDNGFRFNQPEEKPKNTGMPTTDWNSMIYGDKGKVSPLINTNEKTGTDKPQKTVEEIMADIDVGKKLKGKKKDQKDDTLALGVPQNYSQTNAYSVITEKIGTSTGSATGVADKATNSTEKPVINMATRVEEIAGSLRKIAAITALPVMMTLGAANASTGSATGASGLMPVANTQHNINTTEVNAPVSHSNKLESVHNAFDNRLYQSSQQITDLSQKVSHVTSTANHEENNLLSNFTESANNYTSSASSLTADNSTNSLNNDNSRNYTSNKGKTIHFDRFTDKIEIHVSGVDSPRLAADQVRNEVEKALAEILNV